MHDASETFNIIQQTRGSVYAYIFRVNVSNYQFSIYSEVKITEKYRKKQDRKEVSKHPILHDCFF